MTCLRDDGNILTFNKKKKNKETVTAALLIEILIGRLNYLLNMNAHIQNSFRMWTYIDYKIISYSSIISYSLTFFMKQERKKEREIKEF